MSTCESNNKAKSNRESKREQKGTDNIKNKINNQAKWNSEKSSV